MMRRIAVALLTAFTLAACASPKYVVSDVTRFHTLPAKPSGQSFVIATLDKEQGESLAYKQHTDTVTAKMVSMGLKPFDGPISGADLVVAMRYDVSEPTPDIKSRTSSVGIGVGGGWGHPYGPGYGYGRHDPFYDNYTDTKQLFVRKLEINIYKGLTFGTDKQERVFEGRAVSAGLNAQLAPVVPYMIDAVFQNFPGRSGEAQRVFIEVPAEDAKMITSGPSSRSSY